MDRDWLARLAHDLSATRAELLGLVLLVVGGIVLTVVVVGRVDGTVATGGDGGSPDERAGVAGVDGDASPGSDPAGDASGGAGEGGVGEAAAGDSGGAGGDDPGALASAPDGASGTDPSGGVGTPVVVHVTGAVVAPGVLELPAGARLVDALEAAGGPTGEAAPDVLNLAAELRDGQQLHVPTAAEVEAAAAAATTPPQDSGTAGTGSGGAGSGAAAGGTGLDPTTGRPPTPGASPPTGPDGGGATEGGTTLVDLNRAGATELESLPGVGPVLAGRIVAWREEHGGFTSVGQLRDVSGIGEKTFQALAPLVVVS